ncbi:CpaF family protein [Candidatus Micrarchaeota archaeon]|nr:CpaF family protein [Candidatus Micrarchaeota archaeon]
MLKTKIDLLLELLKSKGRLSYNLISKELSWNVSSIEKVALILENEGFVKTHYPVTFIQPPYLTLASATPPSLETEVSTENVLDYYELAQQSDVHVKGKVFIQNSLEEKRSVYRLYLDIVSPASRAYLNSIKVQVASRLPVSGAESNKEENAKLLDLRVKEISSLIKKDLEVDVDELERLSSVVLNEMYGLGKLEALIGDERLEEIVINSSRIPVLVYHRQYGWLKTNVHLSDEFEIENYAEQIARRVGRQISLLNPILDAHLSTGDRVNATLYPISAHGNTITLRLFARNPWTMVSYLRPQSNSMSYEMAALLWQGMQYEMNIIIAGGTASGKTSALNGLLALVQPFQRIVTIEDTRELVLPSFQWNWVPLVTRQPNPEGAGEVTMLDLVVNALRMRPDRIVMGEIRRKKEAEVMFEAMHTGHSVYSTIHADTGAQVIKRLTEPPIDLPPAQVEDVHLLVVQYRDRRRNLRRTLELSEILPGEGKPDINRLYNWRPRTDTFQPVKPPRRYVEQLNLHTGMTESEIEQDQKDKIEILHWMVKNNLDQVEPVGRVMKVYYSDPNAILDAAKKDLLPNKVL